MFDLQLHFLQYYVKFCVQDTEDATLYKRETPRPMALTFHVSLDHEEVSKQDPSRLKPMLMKEVS